MYRLLVVAALLAGACGTSTDDRPQTVEYITEAILKPSCGAAQCHSSMVQAKSYVFDTVEASRATLRRVVSAGDGDGSFIIQVMTRKVKRMPYDAPIPDADIDLIREWINNGAPGL